VGPQRAPDAGNTKEASMAFTKLPAYAENEIASKTILTLITFPLVGGGNCKAKKPKYGPANKIGTGI